MQNHGMQRCSVCLIDRAIYSTNFSPHSVIQLLSATLDCWVTAVITWQWDKIEIKFNQGAFVTTTAILTNSPFCLLLRTPTTRFKILSTDRKGAAIDELRGVIGSKTPQWIKNYVPTCSSAQKSVVELKFLIRFLILVNRCHDHQVSSEVSPQNFFPPLLTSFTTTGRRRFQRVLIRRSFKAFGLLRYFEPSPLICVEIIRSWSITRQLFEIPIETCWFVT